MAWPCPLSASVLLPCGARHRLEALVSALATALAPHVAPRATVAVFRLPTAVALPALFAIARLRAVPVLLNHRCTPADLRRALAALPCPVLLTAPATAFPPAPPPAALVLALAQAQPSLPAYHVAPLYRPARLVAAPSLPPNTAAVFFTSGTTSAPKPVPLTYQNLTCQANSKIQHLPLSPATVYLHLAPLYHLAGFSSTLAVTLAGATHVIPPELHPSNRIHATLLLSLVPQYSVTLLVAVPATLRLLIDASDGTTLRSVNTILYGGSAASDTLLAHLNATFPRATILAAYGMTETASTLAVCRQNAPLNPLPHVHFAVLRDDTTITAFGRGEILTRGPHVFPGYYGRAREGFIKDWFRTGDIAHLTERGALVLLGRKVEMIKSGGEKVYAGEVESVLMGHSSVREAAVVGLPDRVLGEAVAACVVLIGDGGKDAIDSVRGFCRAVLAGFKCPRWFCTLDELPRNATGKVEKMRVRKILEANLTPRARL